MQNKRKDTRIPNHVFRWVRKITKCECFLRNVWLSDYNNSYSTPEIFPKFNIWLFSRNLWRRTKFPWNLTNMSGILQNKHLQLL